MDAAGVTAFINSAENRARMIDSFSATAFSDVQAFMLLTPNQIKEMLFDVFTTFVHQQTGGTVDDNVAVREALGRALCTNHSVFINAALAAPQNVARIGRAIAEVHLATPTGVIERKHGQRGSAIRSVLNEYWDSCYGGQLSIVHCNAFAASVRVRMRKIVLGPKEANTRVKSFEVECSKIPRKEYWEALPNLLSKFVGCRICD